MANLPLNLLIFRRSSASGGAELAALRLKKQFETYFRGVKLVHNGLNTERGKIPKNWGPGWLRVIRYANAVNRIFECSDRGRILFSMERGVHADIYRAGEGVHQAWMQRRGMMNSFRMLHPVLIALERRTVRDAKVVVANSELIAKELRTFYPDYQDKVRVIESGFDPSRFSVLKADKKDEARKDGERQLCFAGNGWERKGLSTAIDLLSELPGQWRLQVLGRGNEKKYFRYADRLGCGERVEFCGLVDDVERYYNSSDVFVLPTKYDPFSNACLEAMACGCPVITTSDNGFASLIDDRNTGFVLDSTNLKECAKWCESELPKNKEEIARSVEEFTIERETKRYIDVFESVRKIKSDFRITFHPSPAANENHSRSKFSILIPTWNNLEMLKLCVRALRENSKWQHQIVIHINEGNDGTLEWAKESGLAYTHSDRNCGICYGMNSAATLAETDYIAYLNDDMYVLPDWDVPLVDEIENLDHSMFYLSATLIEPEGSRNECVIAPKDYGRDLASFDEESLLKDYGSLEKSDWSGSTWPLSVVPRDLWNLVGGYSSEFSPGLGSDPDFSMKLWALGVRHFKGLGSSRIYHFMAKTTSRIPQSTINMNDSRTRFLNKWGVTISTFSRHYLRLGDDWAGPLETPVKSTRFYFDHFRSKIKKSAV